MIPKNRADTVCCFIFFGGRRTNVYNTIFTKAVTDLNLPNVYRAEIGFMDLTVNEVTELIRGRGMHVNPTEVTRAIRGGTEPKHYSIRAAISEIFNEWCRTVGDEFGIYPEISVSCQVRGSAER